MPKHLATTPWHQRLRTRLRAFWPAPLNTDLRERTRASCGALLGILLVAACAAGWQQGGLAHAPSALALALVAPLGASAVLVFALPASPLAQPWSVVGGNTLSALVGIACARWLPDATLAAAVAVGMAIALMMLLRCLHPPGGAAALLMVLAGADRFSVAASPVLLDSLLLVAGGLLYNNLTRRPWPHPQWPAPAETRLQRDDLNAVLARRNQVLDISASDLLQLLEEAQATAYQRTLGQLRCAEAMSPQPHTARADTPLREAWATMRTLGIKALPVVDSQRHLLGIVTVADFMRQIDLDVHEGLAWRLRAWLRTGQTRATGSVGAIMTRSVRVASSDRLLIDLVPVFSDGGHRHLPIIDAERRLVGIITQSDLIRALYHAVKG